MVNNMCKICNKSIEKDLPHKKCKMDKLKNAIIIEIEEYENIIKILRIKYDEKYQQVIQLNEKVSQLTEQIRIMNKNTIDLDEGKLSIDLFSEFDDDLREQSLNNAICGLNSRSHNKFVKKEGEETPIHGIETKSLEMKKTDNVQNLKSPIIRKSKLTLRKATNPLNVSNVNIPTKWVSISKVKLDSDRRQAFQASSMKAKEFVSRKHTNLNDSKENEYNNRKTARSTNVTSNFMAKKLRQSTLSQFTSDTEILEKKLLQNCEENDETYCEDLVLCSQTSIKDTRRRLCKSNNLNNFITIKKELTANISNDDSNSLLMISPPISEVIEIGDSMNIEVEDIFDSMIAAKEKIELEEKCFVKENNYEQDLTSKGLPKNNEKPKQPYNCIDCERFYNFLGRELTAKELQESKCKCKNKRQNLGLPATPEGFWKPFFTPTQHNN